LKYLFCWFLLQVILSGCSDKQNSNVIPPNSTHPKATGDQFAIDLAQKVINESGGLDQWNKIPFLSFDYFGRRYWYWDKIHNTYRVESEIRNFRIAGKLDGSETHLWLRGALNNQPDTLSKYKDFAYKAWINDTYWLIFPFKLLDPGVHLRYLGECMADSIIQAKCIELTFDNVGVTPENKYIAYIDTLKNEIIYWDYFENKEDSLPALSNSWYNYRKYGNVKIAGGRGDDSIREIKTPSELPKEIFEDVSKSHTELLNKG